MMVKKFLKEFLSLTPESIFKNRNYFEYKNGIYLNTNNLEDRKILEKY